MKIKILAFGIVKEIFDSNNIELEFENEISVTHLKNNLIEKYPKLKALKHFSVAVNQNYVDDNFVISENNEVVILPPVSGG